MLHKAVAVTRWGCSDDTERLEHETITDAVRAWVEDVEHDEISETVTVFGFAPRDLPPATEIAAWIIDSLDGVYERLDEEFGDPDGDQPGPTTDAVKEAAVRFAEVIRAEYGPPWMCELVAEETVRVADHVPAEWLANRTEGQIPDYVVKKITKL